MSMRGGGASTCGGDYLRCPLFMSAFGLLTALLSHCVTGFVGFDPALGEVIVSHQGTDVSKM